MGRLRFAWLLAAQAVVACAWAQQAPPRELLVDAMVRVGNDGVVRDYHLESDLRRPLAERVEKAVRGWRFRPVAGGDASGLRTRVLLTLQPASDKAWEDGWKVVDVDLGTPLQARRALLMPDYPLAALRAHLSARVLVAARLNARGKPDAVHAERVDLGAPGGERLAADWREIFVDPALRAAKGWRFVPGPQLAGTTIRVAVYSVYDGDRAHRYYPGPYSPAPWLQDDATPDDVPDAGEVRVLDARVHLAQDVVGQVI